MGEDEEGVRRGVRLFFEKRDWRRVVLGGWKRRILCDWLKCWRLEYNGGRG